MITVSVAESNLGERHILGRHNASWLGQSRVAPCVLLNVSDHVPPTVLERDAGRLVQGTEVFGLLRDKEVQHFSISADLHVSARSYQYDILDGYPRARRAGGTLVPYRAVIDWRNEHHDQFSLVWGSFVYQGATYYRDPTLYDHQFVWSDSDYLIEWTEVTTAPAYRNGSQFLAGSVQTNLTLYKRKSGLLYSLYSFVNISGSRTLGEVLTALSPYYGRTGTRLYGYSDLGTTWYGNPVQLAEELVEGILQRESPHNLIGTEPVDFGEMSLDITKQLDYVDSNILLLIFDVAEWRNFHETWKSIINAKGWKRSVSILKRGGRSMRKKDFLHALKPGSQSYLWYKYAVRTTSSDVARLNAGLKEFILRPLVQRLHTRKVVTLERPGSQVATYTAVMTVECDSYPNGLTDKIQEFIGEVKRWGVYPDMSNLYDMLKYSFVVDWFVQFGDFIQQIQAYLDVKDYFPVKYVIMSSKWQIGYPSTEIVPDIPATGDVTYRYYVRWISRQLPLPPVALELGSGPVGHGVEAGALILQRVK